MGRELKFKLRDTTLTSDVNQTLSNLLAQTNKVNTKVEIIGSRVGGFSRLSLEQLTDVLITSVQTGQTIQWNGTDWVNVYSGPNLLTAPGYLGNWEGTPFVLTPGGQGNFSNSAAVNTVEVFMFRLDFPMSFNTLTFQTANSSPNGTVAFGVYSYSGNRLVHWDNFFMQFNNFKMQAQATGGPVLLLPGYYYWAYASSLTSSLTSAGSLVNSHSGESVKPWNNNGIVRTGFATNLMSAGVLPATLGALTAGFPVTVDQPVWIVEP